MPNHERPSRGRVGAAFLAGVIVAVLGGVMGLGGAEFRPPLLIGMFGLAALQAVIVNRPPASWWCSRP